MNIRKSLCAATVSLLLAGTPALAVDEPGALPLQELRSFADVFNQIRVGYVEEIDDSTLLEYAIQGMLTGLDPHSVYLSEDAFSELQDTTSGEFSGLAAVKTSESEEFIKISNESGDSVRIAEGSMLLGRVLREQKQYERVKAIDFSGDLDGGNQGIFIRK